MSMQTEIKLLDVKSSSWSRDMDNLRTLLGAPNNQHLFPPHFLKAAFPKIGGRIITLNKGKSILGAGFLFPRALHRGKREFTLRFHKAQQEVKINKEELTQKAEQLLHGDKTIFYKPHTPQLYHKTTIEKIKDIDIGTPSKEEAAKIRNLQQLIWGSSSDFLYPTDIHSINFKTSTSLVARVGRKAVGFLFGFYKFGGPPLPRTWGKKFRGAFRIESQALGVLPPYRGRGIAFLLKKIQAKKGIGGANRHNQLDGRPPTIRKCGSKFWPAESSRLRLLPTLL